MNEDFSHPVQMVEDDNIPTTSQESPPSEMSLPQLNALMSYLSMQDMRDMQTQSARGDLGQTLPYESNDDQPLSPNEKRCYTSNLEASPVGESHSPMNQALHSSPLDSFTKMQSRRSQVSNCSRRYDKYLHKINEVRKKCGLDPLKSSSTKPKTTEKKTRNSGNKTPPQKTGSISNHTLSSKLKQEFNCVVGLRESLSKIHNHQSKISNCKVQFNNIRLQLKELKKMRSFVSPKSSKELNFGEMKIRDTGDGALVTHCNDHTNVNHPAPPKLEERCNYTLESFGEVKSYSCESQPLHSSLPDPVLREHSRPKKIVNCRLRYNKLLYHLKELRKMQPVVVPTTCLQELKFGEKLTLDMGDQTPHRPALPRGQCNMNPLPPIQEERDDCNSESFSEAESCSNSQMLDSNLPDPLTEMQSHQSEIPVARKLPEQISCVINNLDKMSL